jgi:hypothetical protein
MTSQEICLETLKQLGGNKFIVMTGAKCISDGNTLIVKFKMCPKANIMYITLNGKDLYDVKICKFRGMEVKTVAELNDAYSDMLRPFFTETTGLRTSL